MSDFQERNRKWVVHCFGQAIADDRVERNHRFLEEALELAQACGCTLHEALQLVDYVYGRPTGDKAQEVGGVMNTLAALCTVYDLDLETCAEVELARVWKMVDIIRTKQAAKPKHSPLPMATDTEIWCSCGDAIVPDDPGLCGNCASRLRAELESSRNQVTLLAMALATVSEELKSLLEAADMARALPATEQEIIDFIGSNFDVHQHSSPDGTPLDLADQRFTLSVHDLLSAFGHWRLSGGTLGSEACG